MKKLGFIGAGNMGGAIIKGINRKLGNTAVLIALDLVLKTFLNVQVTEELKLNFAFVAVAAIGMLYGPTVAGAACFVTDILGYFPQTDWRFLTNVHDHRNDRRNYLRLLFV